MSPRTAYCTKRSLYTEVVGDPLRHRRSWPERQIPGARRIAIAVNWSTIMDTQIIMSEFALLPPFNLPLQYLLIGFQIE